MKYHITKRERRVLAHTLGITKKMQKEVSRTVRSTVITPRFRNENLVYRLDQKAKNNILKKNKYYIRFANGSVLNFEKGSTTKALIPNS